LHITTDHQTVLCALLKRLRKQKGLNQAQLAAQLGKPQSFVSKYESGERRLDILELRQVCWALGLTLTMFAQQLETELNASE